MPPSHRKKKHSSKTTSSSLRLLLENEINKHRKRKERYHTKMVKTSSKRKPIYPELTSNEKKMIYLNSFKKDDKSSDENEANIFHNWLTVPNEVLKQFQKKKYSLSNQKTNG